MWQPVRCTKHQKGNTVVWPAVDVGARGDERLQIQLRAAIAIGRMPQARDTAAMLNQSAGWQALAAAAVHTLDVSVASE